MDTEKRVHEKFVTILRERSMNVLDLKPVFEAADDPMSFTFSTDPHWNEDGHKLAADALHKHILDNKLL